VVLLSHVRDPGNAGTVIRGADAAGADAVLVSDASVDVWSPKVVRSTAGSLFHLPVVTGLPVEGAAQSLREAGIRLLAADGAGTVLLPDVDLGPAHAWVMGNEAWGLPPELRNVCDEVVRVPIYGQAESLNLAMAATICLYASASAQNH
jgi:TrmH family RNA methyltransferase